MIVEVCLLLRIVLNEHQHLTLQRVSVAPCGATKEPIKDVPPKFTMKPNSDYVPTADSWDVNANLNSLWVYRPPQLVRKEHDSENVQLSLKTPFAITRLAKPLNFGFDPFFNKGYFEPFESRQKPVTLVAFRRNGFLPKQSIKVEEPKSSELAEMQSPFNEISSFWQDEPGLIPDWIV